MASYLGVPFNSSGICWKAMVEERTTKAKQVIATLAPLGFNARGWAPAASARIYKTFVRPVMEYGLALFGHGMPANLVGYYERVQTLALRTLTSTPKNTSKIALMKLLQVEPMSFRAKMLNLNWAARLNSSGDASNLAVKVFHYATQPARTTLRTSLPKAAMRNPLWDHPEARASNWNQVIPSDFFCPLSLESQWLLLQWCLGAVTCYEECKKSEGELTTF
ncbi:UNVERIFIED_CONTAM: hypothetical protein HDU68_012020 [Siphonaria sp. JEL0065]|nr:hypothetical protein HDU68_012020 [Siphonaria sp. JEL0065]